MRSRSCRVCSGWHDLSQPWPRECLPPPAPRSAFPLPMIRSDAIEPIQSMADGVTYESLSSLRRSYRADGNPQGIEYQEIGNEKRTDPVMPKVTEQECADLLDQHEAAMARGQVPEMRSIHDPI